MFSKEFPAVAETVEELSARLRGERDARLRTRLHLLLLIRSGEVHSRREAADHLRIHRNSVTNWLALYEARGLQGLLSVAAGGPPAEQKTLPEDVYKDLSDRVAAGEFETYVAAREWLRSAHGLEVSYRTVHSLIRYRLGAKLNRRRAD